MRILAQTVLPCQNHSHSAAYRSTIRAVLPCGGQSDDRQTLCAHEIKLFSNLSPDALDAIAAVARLSATDDGEIIMLEGDAEAPVFCVVRGIVRVFRTNPDGREQTLIYHRAGAAFNLPSAFLDEPTAPASAMAICEGHLLVVSRADFRRVATETPEIAFAVLHDLSGKLLHLTRLTHDLSLVSVRGRLARLLLSRAQAEDQTLLRWTQGEIAADIGTVREVVNRTLRAFAQEGLIEIQRQRITILDLAGLEAESEF